MSLDAYEWESALYLRTHQGVATIKMFSGDRCKVYPLLVIIYKA